MLRVLGCLLGLSLPGNRGKAPLFWFVELGFSFTYNGGATLTKQATTGHNAFFAQQIHLEVDLYAWPIVWSLLLLHSGELEDDQVSLNVMELLRNFYNNVTINVTGNFLP